MAAFTPFLSKSRFIKGLQCHKALWLQTNRPELKAETTPQQQAVFDTGHDVGLLAQQLFPGGVEVPFEGVKLSEQIRQTRELIESGAETIYEAAFSYDNVFVKADIMHRVNGRWRMGEVKSSTQAKEVYINDASVQYYVITGCGIPLESAGLVLIDTDYVRMGDVEPDKLFTWVDITAEVLDRQGMVPDEIRRQREMLLASEPVIDIGPHCSDPYACDFQDYCWAHIPSPSVFDFADIGKPNPFALYRQGIIRMEDTPRDTLGWRQELQLDGHLNRSMVVDAKAVKEFLTTLTYPLCFLDFETTYMTAVPLFDGTSPFQQVPFQFSLHIQDTATADARHIEFLHDGIDDPRKAFLQALLAGLPHNACVLTWNKAFERKILRALAEQFPQHRNRIGSILENMVDLMAPFRSKQIYHWQFDGSYSIKAVLPALVPELSYGDLTISDGGAAASAWLALRATSDAAEKEQIRKYMLAYCHLDTLAMVRILDKMREMVS